MKRYFIFTLLFLTACVPMQTSVPTEDPYVELALAEMEAARISGNLTATQQSWIFQGQAWTVTAQSWTATPSLTPLPTSTPTITSTPTVDVTGTMAVELMNAEIERVHQTNAVRAWAPYFVAFLALALASFLGFVGAKRLSMMPTPIHERTGKPVPMINVYDGVVVDTDRMPNGMAVMSRKYVASLPAPTDARQADVTARAQGVDLQTRIGRLPRGLVDAQGTRLLEAPGQVSAGNEAFERPEWEKFVRYPFEMGKPFPYAGKGSELALVDLQGDDQFGVIAPTGYGKSRFFLRPLTAGALAAGYQVVIIGDMVDFAIFGAHKNAVLVPVSDVATEQGARQYVNILQGIYAEMIRRWELLAEHGGSTWDRMGGVNTLINLDEIGVAIEILESLNPPYARTAKALLSGLVKKGRKAGMRFAFSSQRAVGLKNLLSQVWTVVSWLKDQDEERYALGRSGYGASELPKGYFLSKPGPSVFKVGTWNPTDEQIGNFLLDHKATELERPAWVDGIARTLPTPEIAPALSAPKTDLEKLAESIRPDWSPEMSKRKVAQLIGKEYAGGAVKIVDALISLLNSNLSTEGVV